MESRRPRSMIVARAHGRRGPSEHRQKKQLRSRAEALPRRAIAYIRESTEEQGKDYSPEGSDRRSPATPTSTRLSCSTNTSTSRGVAPPTLVQAFNVSSRMRWRKPSVSFSSSSSSESGSTTAASSPSGRNTPSRPRSKSDDTKAPQKLRCKERERRDSNPRPPA